MDFLLAQLLTGLAGASSLFLVAAGLTVIFGVTRVVNFGHGSLTMLGAYIGWSILTRLPRDPASFALGVLLAAAATGLIGLLIETVLLRRIYRAPELFQLLATFGVVLMVGGSIPGQTRTAAVALYDRVQAFDDRGAGLMAAALLGVSLVALLLSNLLSRRVGRRSRDA